MAPGSRAGAAAQAASRPAPKEPGDPDALDRQLRTVLESTTDSVLVLSGDWRFTFLNRRAMAQIAQGRDLVGHNIWEAFPEAVGGPVWHAYQRCHRERVPTEAEQFYPPLGRVFAARAFPIEGEPGITVFFRDVTEERAASARLLETEGMLRALGEVSLDLLFVKDLQGRFLYANPATLRFLGLTADELLGQTDRDFLPHEDADPIMAADQRVMRSGEPEQVIERVTDRRTGATRHFQNWKAPMRDRLGAVVGLAGGARDVTDARQAAQALAESEARFRAIFDHAAIGVGQCGLDGRWQRVNRRFCDMLGYTEAEMLCLTFRDITHPDDLPADEAAVEAMLSGQTAHVFLEKRYVAKTGLAVWTRLSGSLVRDAAGLPDYYVAVVEDVSEHKSAEATLRAFFDASPLMMTLFEPLPDGDLLRISQNAAADQFLGETFNPRAAPTAREFGISPEKLSVWQSRCAEVLAAGRPLTFEHVSRKPGGGERILLTTLAPLGVPGPRGGPAFCQVSDDVTERRQSENALAENEARLQELLASLDLASILVRDLDQTITFWSRGCERLYGWRAEEAVGQRAIDLLAVVYPVPIAEIEAQLFREGEWHGDLLHKRKDGSALTVAARKVLRRDRDGRPVAVMESVADVTALRQAQRDLRQLNETLNARVQAEVAARQGAQMLLAHAQRMEALGQLAGGIAHDFNNVIQAVQGGASLLARRSDDPAARRIAEMIEEAARRGASVTRRLLAFARRDELHAETFELPPLLDGLRDVLHSAFGPGVDLRFAAAPALPPLHADRGQLETVLVNLATNARDAMPAGGTLTIGAEIAPPPPGCAPGRDYVRLTVEDTGTGMSPETLARAAEPFFTTKPVGKGTGLGLSMAKGFAEQSGGCFVIESKPGKGTKVRLWLPGAVAGEVTTGPAQGTPERRAGQFAERVLLVDDEPLVREVLAELLADRGYAVAIADGPNAASAMLADPAERIDMLVTDFSMPGMDGIRLIRDAQAARPGLPALLLTGYAGDAATLAGNSPAAAPFLLMRKPVSAAELAARVEACLQERPSG